MPDTRVKHCLELCSHAHHLEGEHLSEALDKLHDELSSLLN